MAYDRRTDQCQRLQRPVPGHHPADGRADAAAVAGGDDDLLHPVCGGPLLPAHGHGHPADAAQHGAGGHGADFNAFYHDANPGRGEDGGLRPLRGG